MKQLEEFGIPNEIKKLYKLQRLIYGLKKDSNIWNFCFDETVKQYRFVKNKDEPCV